MQAAGLRGVSRRKSPTTTQRAPGTRAAPDLVNRDFTAERPDELSVADDIIGDASSPFVPTSRGFLYLAVVLDAFSRRIVGGRESPAD